MHPGTQIGAYRILRPIGEGGMGTVYLAEHTTLGRRAALKVLHPMLSVRDEMVMRFFNEARAASAISDPGIVQIFDVGRHVDGCAYIVMELLEGEPLDRRLRRVGALPAMDAVRVIRQVANSLGAAHARGIVHRDIKPENIYMVPDAEVISGERAKLLDFGIAKLVNDANFKTNTSAVMGTPAFMSPEQCRGAGKVDARSDVYSLGCVLFTLISGRPVFEAEGGGEVIAMHLREAPPLLSTRVRGVGADLDSLIARCLEKDPARRFSTGSALAVAVTDVLTSAGLAESGHYPTRQRGPAQRPSPRPSPHTTLSGAAGTRNATRRVVIGSGGVLIAAIAIVVFATAVVLVFMRSYF